MIRIPIGTKGGLKFSKAEPKKSAVEYVILEDHAEIGTEKGLLKADKGQVLVIETDGDYEVMEMDRFNELYLKETPLPKKKAVAKKEVDFTLPAGSKGKVGQIGKPGAIGPQGVNGIQEKPKTKAIKAKPSPALKKSTLNKARKAVKKGAKK